MDKNIDLTVLLTVYNGEKYLREAIESILSQTLTEFEFLIIDDGSTDSSLNIINEYAVKDSRIKVIHKEKNQGLVHVKNEGIQTAKGKFLALMDSDDISLPERLKKQYDYLISHTECVVVGTKSVLIDPDGRPLCPWPCLETHEEIDAFHMNGQGGGMIQPSCMMRLNFIKNLNGYSNKYPQAEDYDFLLKIAEASGRLANIPEVLYKYRQHLSSIGYTKQLLQKEQTYNCIKDAYSRRNLPFNLKLTLKNEAKPISISEHYKKWGWWALGSGYVSTARKYAFKTFIRDPLSLESLRLLFCSIRGH